ncbi:MAG: 3TM-type holin [Thiolinea sp.]
MSAAIAQLLIGPIAGLLDKIIPDKDQREKLAHEIATLAEKQANQQILAQIEVNKQEAAHKSLFVAGWRPGAGWVCVLAMAFNFLVAPLLDAAGFGVETLDISSMMPVLLGMLGLGGMRSFEKRNGVARER